MEVGWQRLTVLSSDNTWIWKAFNPSSEQVTIALSSDSHAEDDNDVIDKSSE